MDTIHKNYAVYFVKEISKKKFIDTHRHDFINLRIKMISILRIKIYIKFYI